MPLLSRTATHLLSDCWGNVDWCELFANQILSLGISFIRSFSKVAKCHFWIFL
ncbi:hypothetical protein D3C85_1588360 [compost metagenome]